ncbi:hypothetical protein DPMN_032879 [Dreissena polymorpha]|uniref:Uncharacterized protein n=1 Tax=Dreissena polymorpha TaxID=45954 RepID=A0A9D4M5L9_DREPO|nr:hypothetical protein DPMN_032879 [Dreissena polymorpha]
MLSTSFALSGSEFKAAIVEGKKECWYREVLVRAPSRWDELRKDLADRSPTDSGESEDKYSGLRPLTILKKRMSLCLDLLVLRISQPISLESYLKDTSRVHPETMMNMLLKIIYIPTRLSKLLELLHICNKLFSNECSFLLFDSFGISDQE